MLQFSEVIERSVAIRKKYHLLEQKYHEKEWTVEEDALAFLTDAGLVGRFTMAQQGRWPVSGDPEPELEHKLSECMWWIITLAERMDMIFTMRWNSFLRN